MLDSKNILLDVGRGSAPDSTGVAENTQDPAAENPSAFSTVFGHAAATLKVAKSGNDLPPSAADKKPVAQTPSPDSSMISRTLKGGTSLIIGGDEPTDEGLVAFARAQGMDPDMLGLMTAKPHKVNQHEAQYQAAAANMPVDSGNSSNLTDHSRLQFSANLTETPSAVISARETDNKQISKPKGIANQLAMPALEKPLAISVEASQLVDRSVLRSGQLTSQPVKQELSIPKITSVDTGSKKIADPRVAGEVEKNLTIKAETLSSNDKLGGANKVLSPTASQDGASKLVIAPKIAEALIAKAKDRQHLPATKVEPIILSVDKAGLIPLPTSAAAGATGAVVAPIFVEGPTAATQTATLAEQVTDRQSDDPRQDLLRRQDDYMQLSRQLADALGKRLTAQIQQGSWRVEMDLHPKTLGRIEVQLEMKNGEIEARFLTANAATRDLINEGMPRLREAFQEHGTETAYVDVGTANQGFSDGKSTASEDADKGASDRLTAASDDIDGATENRHAGLASDEDGLNILV